MDSIKYIAVAVLALIGIWADRFIGESRQLTKKQQTLRNLIQGLSTFFIVLTMGFEINSAFEEEKRKEREAKVYGEVDSILLKAHQVVVELDSIKVNSGMVRQTFGDFNDSFKLFSANSNAFFGTTERSMYGLTNPLPFKVDVEWVIEIEISRNSFDILNVRKREDKGKGTAPEYFLSKQDFDDLDIFRPSYTSLLFMDEKSNRYVVYSGDVNFVESPDSSHVGVSFLEPGGSISLYARVDLNLKESRGVSSLLELEGMTAVLTNSLMDLDKITYGSFVVRFEKFILGSFNPIHKYGDLTSKNIRFYKSFKELYSLNPK